MKLDRNTLFASAMLLASFAAIGCQPAQKGAPAEEAKPIAAAEAPAGAESPLAEAPAIAEAPATIPAKTIVTTPAAPATEEALYAPYAPPAPRFENPGRAPGKASVFIPGSWRWTGREYAWAPGRWEMRRAGYDYQAPRFENVKGRWMKRGGYWKASVRVDSGRREAPRHPGVAFPKHPKKPAVAAKVSVTLGRR